MSYVREYTKSKGNLTIKAKIDLRPKIVVKTTAICAIIALVILGEMNDFKWCEKES